MSHGSCWAIKRGDKIKMLFKIEKVFMLFLSLRFQTRLILHAAEGRTGSVHQGAAKEQRTQKASPEPYDGIGCGV